MVFNLTIKGPDALESAFDDFSVTLFKYGVKEVIDFTFLEGEGIARVGAPVRTGWLRSNIKYESTNSGAKLISRALYSIYVNAHNPFFTKAVEHIRRELPPRIQRAINTQASRMSRKYFPGA